MSLNGFQTGGREMSRAGHMARVRVAVVCGAILIALTAIASATSQPRQSRNLGTVKIGVLFPLTGTNASAGQDTLHGVQLAAAVLNGQYRRIKLPRLTEIGRASCRERV